MLDDQTKGLYIGPMVWREMYDFSEHAVLLVMASKHYDVEDYKNYIYEVLGEYGCECEFEEPVYDKYGWIDNGYIDHGYELKDWLDSLRHSKKKLLRYLFSPYSYIVTTNDNTYDLEEYLDGYLTENSDKYDVCMKYN